MHLRYGLWHGTLCINYECKNEGLEDLTESFNFYSGKPSVQFEKKKRKTTKSSNKHRILLKMKVIGHASLCNTVIA